MRIYFLLCLLPVVFPLAAPAANESLVFISTFAPGKEGAITSFRLDPRTGRLAQLQRTTGVENCYFIAIAPSGRTLYAIHAPDFEGKEHSQVAAYAIDGQTGGLNLLNRQSTRGATACYIHADPTGRVVLVANYTSGSVVSLPVREDGSLGEVTSLMQHAGRGTDPERQEGPHAHSILGSPDNRFACAADLGLDQVISYRLEPANARLRPHDTPAAKTPPGAGPRHLAFHPDGKRLYAINELANSITAFDYDAESGTLAPRQTLGTLPADFKGKSYCADVKITPDGRFLYATNRGHDSIAAFSIAGDGRLALVAIEPSLGKVPANLAIAPAGDLLLCANMSSNEVVAFRIDPKTGRLAPLGQPSPVPSPSCIRILAP